MKKISRFDIGIIIAFVVITLLGAGAWFYLSGQLSAAKDDVSSAASDFDKYSTRETYLPNGANQRTLQANIDLLKAKLDPLIKTKLQAPGNKLPNVTEEDTVAWKHDLDAEVLRLNGAAKVHGVNVPNNFYYGFSRYLNQNPRDEQTEVLRKQLLGVEEIANSFINAPVKAIYTFRRTYEEDPPAGSNFGGGKTDPDFLPGNAVTAAGNIYIAYPFEIEFEASKESFRKVVTDLQTSPYVFVIRSLTIQNSTPTSPQISDLDKIAGSTPGVIDSGPGGSAASSARGPQFLFGNETLHIKARIDMIEWKGVAESAPATTRSRTGSRNGRTGAAQ